jgi:hypothetical protein
MKRVGLGVVEALAERRVVAKTCWRKQVLWQEGGQRRELAAVVAMDPTDPWHDSVWSPVRCGEEPVGLMS